LANHSHPACPSSSLAMSGHAKDLEDRITSIMRPDRVFFRRPAGLAVATVLVLTACIVPMRFSTSARATPGVAETAPAPEAIDLSRYLNATLGQTWLPGTGENSLGDLPAGTLKLGGVP